MSSQPTYFSTEAADQCFLNEFVRGTSAVLGGEINPKQLCNQLRSRVVAGIESEVRRRLSLCNLEVPDGKARARAFFHTTSQQTDSREHDRGCAVVD